jgi:hypothetical protein
MLEALRRTGGRVLRGARGDLACSDVVTCEQRSPIRGTPRALHADIVMRAARVRSPAP